MRVWEHLVGPWCVVFNMVFIHFSDCSLCFTHVLGTLMQFTLLLCYIGSYLFPGGVGTLVHHSLPSFSLWENRTWWWSRFRFGLVVW